jgi:hypothetical protein
VPLRRLAIEWAVALSGATLVLFSLQEPAYASQAPQATAQDGATVTLDSQDTEGGGDSGGVPKWAWATLVMAGFVALSVVTMVLARGPVRHAPPPVEAAEPSVEDAQGGDGEGG